MRYKGRIIAIVVVLILTVVIRGYGILYYNYPSNHFPFFSLVLLLVSLWLGKRYDMVKFLADQDTLTNIYNRRYMIHAFLKLSTQLDKKGENLILFFLDINNFKMINDQYGHEMGDAVLKHFSKVLVKSTGKKEIVARFAGDEFIILAPYTDEKGKDLMINQINNELRKSSDVLHIDLSVSIGTSVYPDDSKTLDGLLKIADQEMYKQKSIFKNKTKEDAQEHLGS